MANRMDRILESMSDDENMSPIPRSFRGTSHEGATTERRYSRSPQSPCRMSGTPTIRMRTPTGSVVYNPFQRDVLRKLGGFTCSPGTFRTPPSRQSESTQPFAWSPDVKGDLFPEDIDEHPTSQFQLQERINSQYDEEAQSFIGNFFNSQLVVPSPSESNATPQTSSLMKTDRSMDSPYIPRSSSLSEGTTPTGRKSSISKAAAVEEADVAVQTFITLPPFVDLTAFLPQELFRHVSNEVTRSVPYRPGRTFVCQSCSEKTESAPRCVRRSLFTPPKDEEERTHVRKTLREMLPDFNASSPETYSSSIARCNSSFEGCEKIASPDISPIGSPDKTLNNDEGRRDDGENDTFNMDTGYQSTVMFE